MATKTIRKAFFFRTEQDKRQHRAFILYWYLDKEKNESAFSISPPERSGEEPVIASKYPNEAETEFQGMVQMMELMIQPFEVVIQPDKELIP